LNYYYISCSILFGQVRPDRIEGNEMAIGVFECSAGSLDAETKKALFAAADAAILCGRTTGFMVIGNDQNKSPKSITVPTPKTQQ
jgi:hypothetical protein